MTMRLKHLLRLNYGDALAGDDRVPGLVAVYGSNGAFAEHNRANMLAPAIVVGRKGSFGKVVWAEDGGYCIDTALYVDSRSCRGDLRYSYYLLQTLGLDSTSKDSAVPGLDRSDAHNRSVPQIDLATQKAIAAFLDAETARIDALIEKKERFARLANERWRGALDSTIHGGKSGERPAEFGKDPSLPRGWVVTPLKHLTDQLRPIMYGIVLPGPNVEEGVMIVKGGDVKPGRLDPGRLCKTTVEIEAGYGRSRLRAGDLVVAIRGGIGDVEIVPASIEGANVTQDAARVAPRKGVCARWLRFALTAPTVFAPLEAKATGAAVRGINIFDLKRARIPTPPPEIQVKIADQLEVEAAKIDRLRHLVDIHAARLREFRAALITAAVTGQIDPTDWRRRGEGDRTLERIEAEMAS